MASLKPYKNPEYLRFWAQTVLPTLYDDSLSYYEVLSKIVKWVNSTIQQMEITQENLATVNEALETLTEDVRVLEGRTDVAEADIAQLKTDLKAATARITAAESRLDTVEAKNTEQDSQIADIQQKNATQDSEISGIQQKNAEQDSSISENAANIAEQAAAISQLQKDSSTLTGRIINCEQVNAAQDSKISTIENKNAEQDTAITAATDTAAEAMTEASAAKATANGVDAKATEALEKANAAVATAGGGVMFIQTTTDTINFVRVSSNSYKIEWPLGLWLSLGGPPIKPNGNPVNIPYASSGLHYAVITKGATAISADTVSIISAGSFDPDTHQLLFTFNRNAAGFAFGRNCSFPFPYAVDGFRTDSDEPRYFKAAGSADYSGAQNSPLPTSAIQYAPAGSVCVILNSVSGNTIPAGILGANVHVRLEGGTWSFSGSGSAATAQWLSLSNESGTPVITQTPSNITFSGPVSGIVFSYPSTRTFARGAVSCEFDGGSVSLLVGAVLRNCKFKDSGSFGSTPTLQGCTFDVNSSWVLPTGGTLYDCLAYAVILGGTVTVHGGYITPAKLVADTLMYLYNATLDCTLSDDGVVNVSSLQIDVHNCYAYTLTAPSSTSPKLTGAGLTVPTGFSTNFDIAQISAAKLFPA